MILATLVLQNFRSYAQSKFDFSKDVTVVIGPNTAGKTNLAEAIHLLSTGRSFKGPTDIGLIQFGKEIGRIKCHVSTIQHQIPHKENDENYSLGKRNQQLYDSAGSDKTTLEVVLMSPQ